MKRSKSYSLDRILHWIKCRLVPGYRQKRIDETKRIMDDLKASRLLIIMRLESLIEHSETLLRKTVITNPKHKAIPMLERTIAYRREVLQTLKAGKRREQINVVRLLNTLSMLSSTEDLNNDAKPGQSGNPKP